jgi:glycosyltransferase involved in cell wall biosynthesis
MIDHDLTERGSDSRPAVCIVHHYYYPQHGHVRRDAETLAQAGYDVTVVALQKPGQPREERLGDVQVVRLPLEHERGSLLQYAAEYGRLIGMTFLTLARLHRQKRFQVVEIDNMPDALVFSALVPKLAGAKVILYVFDNMPELFAVTRKVRHSHPMVRLLALQERISAAFADRVIVTQETARQIALRRGVPERKLAVVLNGPDEAIFQSRSPRAPARADGALEIVTHGTILERFGIQVLIDALPRIAAEVPGVRLTIFGEGEYLPSLQERSQLVGVADRVHFGGWVPLDDLPETIARFDLGYVGMLCDNMLSNKLMEYVAVGLPVVAARWPTYEQYFGDADVAYFDAGSPDDLARAVLGVVHDPLAARARAERAQARFRQYGWSVQEQTYRAVFDELAGAARTPAGGSALSRQPVPTH